MWPAAPTTRSRWTTPTTFGRGASTASERRASVPGRARTPPSLPRQRGSRSSKTGSWWLSGEESTTRSRRPGTGTASSGAVSTDASRASRWRTCPPPASSATRPTGHGSCRSPPPFLVSSSLSSSSPSQPLFPTSSASTVEGEALGRRT